MDTTMTLDPIDGQAPRLSETAQSSEKLCRFAERYPAKLREAVLGLAAADPRLAQAMRVFPGLMAELARRRADCPVRSSCLRLILEGAPLKDVARAAGLPLWMRRLPPETFEKPLPKGVAALLPSHEIANHLLRSPKQAARWLEVVIEAANVCDGRFAVWLAREQAHWCRRMGDARIQLLGLYAWHAANNAQRPSSVPHANWSTTLGFEVASRQAKDWLDRIHIRLILAGGEVMPWLKPRSSEGYDFIPLLSAEEIDAEAAAMKNCLIAYGHRVRRQHVQLWSIRRAGDRVATMSVASSRKYPLLAIQQLATCNNGEPPLEVWVAAHNWLTGHPVSELYRQVRHAAPSEIDRCQWRNTWRPYWLAKRRIPDWLPLAPCLSSLRGLRGYDHDYE